MEQKDRWDYLKKEYKGQEIIEETEDFEEPKEMTEEEKQHVKKQMMFLVWLIIIILFGIVAFVIVSKMFDKKEKHQDVPIEENLKEPLPNGEIDIYKPTIQEINNMYNFDVNNPLYEENILKLFNENEIEINNLDFQAKMLLITSNKKFEKYMLEETNLKEYKNKEVVITKKDLEKISSEIFGMDVGIEHSNFKYFYKKNDVVIYFDVTLDGDKYIFTETTGQSSKIRVYRNLNFAEKIADNVYIRYQTLFIKDNKVYADNKFTKLLTTSINEYNNFFKKGQEYNLIFDSSIEEIDESYCLKMIEPANYREGS